MTIQPISDASVALYITPADLKEHGLTPAALTLEGALSLARDAFREAGIELAGPVEIEAYPGTCGVLVFARVRPRSRAWFSFGGLENLAAAARAQPEPRPAPPRGWGGARGGGSRAAGAAGAAARLSEFGRAESSRPHLEASLAEHGRPVWRRDALNALLTYFPV